MSSDNTQLAEAINLSQIASHPAEAMAAMIEVVQQLEKEVATLKARQEHDYERFSGDIFDHGQRLKRIEVVDLGPVQKDRGEILIALLARNQGKMLAKDARKRMRVDKSIFSRLVAKMKDKIEVRPFHTDRRNDLLILRSENG